jgi:hypothetical protein
MIQDVKISKKETREQPDGMVEVYVPNVFDLYPVMATEDASIIETVELVEDADELEQEALFASLCQRGQDPLSLLDGIRWAECSLNEVPIEVLMTDIKSAVTSISSSCTVVFSTVEIDGVENLSYSIQITR